MATDRGKVARGSGRNGGCDELSKRIVPILRTMAASTSIGIVGTISVCADRRAYAGIDSPTTDAGAATTDRSHQYTLAGERFEIRGSLPGDKRASWKETFR